MSASGPANSTGAASASGYFQSKPQMLRAQALRAQGVALRAQADACDLEADALEQPEEPARIPVQIEGKRTLGRKEIAALLGVTVCTFGRMRTRGEWPAPDLAISNRPRWFASHVESLLPSVVKE